MEWKVIKTKAQYNKAIKRAMGIFQSAAGSPNSDELELLLVLLKDYGDKHITLPEIDPIDASKLKTEERWMKVKDLEPLIGSKELRDYLQLPADIFIHTP
jgi:HTH-type transcriptional regulator/antitoxin HigA